MTYLELKNKILDNHKSIASFSATFNLDYKDLTAFLRRKTLKISEYNKEQIAYVNSFIGANSTDPRFLSDEDKHNLQYKIECNYKSISHFCREKGFKKSTVYQLINSKEKKRKTQLYYHILDSI